jgi:hypothetical protein
MIPRKGDVSYQTVEMVEAFDVRGISAAVLLLDLDLVASEARALGF